MKKLFEWVRYFWNKKVKTPISVHCFMEDAQYLPDIMKDFHDCKDIFKRVDKIVQNGKEKSHKNYAEYLPNWMGAHVYVVDFFLWYMGNHGYTLQKDKRNVSFYSFDADMQRFNREKIEELKKFFEAEAEKQQ